MSTGTSIRLTTIGALCQQLQTMPSEITAIADRLKMSRIEIDGVGYYTARQVEAIRKAHMEQHNVR